MDKLRKIRVILGTLFFALITLLFLDFTGTIHSYFSWMASIQFFPAVLALNVGVVVSLIAITLIFGRIYCSVICPLGVMQDIISWFSSKRKGMKFRYNYSKPKNWLRVFMLGLFIIAMTLGFGAIGSIIAPYSAYARIASELFAPLYYWGNNLLAYLAERLDSYAFYSVDVYMKSVTTLCVAIITFLVIFVLSWHGGRTYCNTICPVGTILGFFARYSMLKPIIDKSKCSGCKLCEHSCKSSCINADTAEIDYSRCVTCMNCMSICKKGAIKYCRTQSDSSKSQIQGGRRQFITLSSVALATTAINARDKRIDGGLAFIADKKIPNRNLPVIPGGAVSLQHFADHCTACQLCVSACPNGVLQPSQSLDNFMQPVMNFDKGFCRPECTLCAEVCPTNAISPLPKEEKMMRKIGTARWVKKNCVVFTDDVSCSNCARHCPNGAICMQPIDSENPDSKKFPVVNPERCIGCGACEYVCPSRPFSAIYVDGIEVHRSI